VGSKRTASPTKEPATTPSATSPHSQQQTLAATNSPAATTPTGKPKASTKRRDQRIQARPLRPHPSVNHQVEQEFEAMEPRRSPGRTRGASTQNDIGARMSAGKMEGNNHISVLGSMVDEMYVYMIVASICAVVLVVDAVIGNPLAGVGGIVLGGIVIGGWEWWSSSWQAAIANSVVCAQLRDSNSRLETRSKTATRTAVRASVLYVPLTVGLIAWSAITGGHSLSFLQGVVAGIWSSVAFLLLKGTRYFRFWESRQGKALLRSGHRWAWSENDLEGATKTRRTVFWVKHRTPAWRLFVTPRPNG
jgi:hypothetical protein